MESTQMQSDATGCKGILANMINDGNGKLTLMIEIMAMIANMMNVLMVICRLDLLTWPKAPPLGPLVNTSQEYTLQLYNQGALEMAPPMVLTLQVQLRRNN